MTTTGISRDVTTGTSIFQHGEGSSFMLQPLRPVLDTEWISAESS